MDLFEYQGKECLRRFEVPVPEEARRHHTGRGGCCRPGARRQGGRQGTGAGGWPREGGGIKPAGSPEEAGDVASRILGMDIKGHTVKRVLVERAGDIRSEYYLAFLVDRSARMFLGLMSAKGGIDIEEVADTDPDAIARVHIDPAIGLSDFHARRLVFGAGIDHQARKGAIALIPPFTAPSWSSARRWSRSTLSF